MSSLPSPRIAVVGSINMDLVLRCARFPRPGETIAALAYHQVSGGKGANQAVAVARAGGQSSLIGRVGDDVFGDRLVHSLETYGVDCAAVQKIPDCESGLAFITVEDQGQNTIVIVGGANARFQPDEVRKLEPLIRECSLVMLQLEIPLETVLAVISMARAAGVRVILDPAPAPLHFPAELLDVDLICPNEQEAEQLSGLPVKSVEQAQIAAQTLHERGAKHVVITLGEQGALLCDRQGCLLIPAFTTEAIDTTAAGDAFIGALAVHWAETDNLAAAVRWGNAAGAIAASRRGAQPSLGSRSEIETLEGSHR